MNNQINRVLVDMNQFLSLLPQKNTFTLVEKEKILLHLINLNVQLKEYLLQMEFQSPQEEITFFKIYKPEIISKLIFYNSLYRIEVEKPHYCSKATYKYYKRELLKTHYFFEDNREFYKYYRTKSKHFDNRYFLRNNQNLRMILDSYLIEFDLNYTTSHCFKLSMIIANEQLKSHLEEKLTEFYKKPKKHGQPIKPKNKLKWTANKRDLIEIIYALQENKSVNNGELDIKELVELFELAFDFKLNGYYHHFTRIKGRVGVHTRFLYSLIDAMLGRISK